MPVLLLAVREDDATELTRKDCCFELGVDIDAVPVEEDDDRLEELRRSNCAGELVLDGDDMAEAGL